ncbi:MauE/DoxX family redox-associated membrane protein [Pedobacter xixiisoli]|uniref:Methylamine utilisation protein MauE n=1 Tax=Pedobacter xixiisoli TaxID=1476464 RepID=A0A286A767_9SPHI|nr:MauE/DoxX family redox-associated membrane protein [Pedobacter xixiisoli]SOD17725.1 Methylamine utilisation protein MauE [Pedobacter xixiisoli]
MKTRTIILEIIIFCIIFLWAFDARNKIVFHDAFYRQLDWNPLATDYKDFIFYFLPALEITIAITLIIKPFRKYGLWLSAGLLTFFTGYVYYMLYIDPSKATCDCGSLISGMTWHGQLIINTAFLLLNITGLILYKRKQQDTNLIYK